MENEEPKPPDGKRFYGSVTVSERGQIVIPAEARKDFGIRAGDKLLILGDLDQGIAIVTLSGIQKMMANSAYFFNMVESTMDDKKGSRRSPEPGGEAGS